MAKVIEFYVPKGFKYKWRPPRGEVIQFPQTVMERIAGLLITDKRRVKEEEVPKK
jgi:hypothetical protein